MTEHARISPVYRALEEPILIGGADYSLVMINMAILSFMLASLRFWYWIPVYFLIHMFLRHLAKKDHQARKIYLRYARQANRYDPFPHQSQRMGLRPVGFGREEAC